MATSKALTLFNCMERDLADIRLDQPAGAVLCPLCLECFYKGDLKGPNPRLTIEHIVPQSVGGTEVTLTCKRCNNSHGSKIDVHLVNRIQAHNAFAGCLEADPLHGKLECEGHRLGVSYRRVNDEDGRVHTDISVKGAPKGMLERFAQKLMSGEISDIDFELLLNYNDEYSRLAMIRVDYLFMFYKYGYRYILAEGPSVIRKMIIGEIPEVGQEICRLANQLESCVFDGVDKEPEVVWLPCYLRERLIGHLIIFSIAAGKLRYFSVLMPTHDAPAENVLAQLHTLSKMITGKPFNVQVYA